MAMVNQYDIYWVTLDPTLGSEINKVRPGVVISPNESNKSLDTILIAPITSKIRNYPMRMNINLEEKNGQICLDQMRCLDKIRLKNRISSLTNLEKNNLKKILKIYLID